MEIGFKINLNKNHLQLLGKILFAYLIVFVVFQLLTYYIDNYLIYYSNILPKILFIVFVSGSVLFLFYFLFYKKHSVKKLEIIPKIKSVKKVKIVQPNLVVQKKIIKQRNKKINIKKIYKQYPHSSQHQSFFRQVAKNIQVDEGFTVSSLLEHLIFIYKSEVNEKRMSVLTDIQQWLKEDLYAPLIKNEDGIKHYKIID